MPNNETIVALSTPADEFAIPLIRLSGPACLEIGLSRLGGKPRGQSNFASPSPLHYVHVF
jgi:tRNA U34 5-carboxymethylaminomethyl modifying GTPase MnmE/TrmE